MPSLNIIIIGAGIAGLTAALVLRKNGHRVVLLEKSRFHQELGTATFIGPNCVNVLSKLGIDLEGAGANLCEVLEKYDANGAVKARTETIGMRAKWKSPWYLMHRADLHSALKRHALDIDGDGPSPVLHLSVVIEDIDVQTATVKTADGRVFNGDLVLGADGNKSVTRPKISPSAKLKPWGKSSYRFMAERDVCMADPELAAVSILTTPGCFGEISEKDRKFVVYPCRNNNMLNFCAIVPDSECTASGAGKAHIPLQSARRG